MSSINFSRPPRAAVAVAIAALSIASLAGCVGGPAPTPSPTRSAPVAQSPSMTPTPTSTRAPTTPPPTAAPTPVSIGCNQLVSPQAIYDFNPNFGLQSNYTPAAGSEAATIVSKKGVACSWLNQTSRDTIEVAVANLPAADIARLGSALNSSSKPVTSFGGSGYFTVVKDTGVAEAFSGSFWIVARSTYFSEAADAAEIVNTAIKSLGR